MGYVLRNGKRYYEDAHGNLTLDDVSQAEAERRASRSGAPRSRTYRVASARSGGAGGRASVSIGIFFLVVVILFLGAFLYNLVSDSPSERAIREYMDGRDQIQMVTDETVLPSETEAEQQYLLPDSDSRYLEDQEVEGYTSGQVQMMINEIYARHGRVFELESNRTYFEGQSWYHPVPGKTDEVIEREFNDYERANIALLSQYR